jgi:hypothetical protein
MRFAQLKDLKGQRCTRTQGQPMPVSPDHLADHQPIIEHPHRYQVLLDARGRMHLTELLDVAGNMHRNEGIGSGDDQAVARHRQLEPGRTLLLKF